LNGEWAGCPSSDDEKELRTYKKLFDAQKDAKEEHERLEFPQLSLASLRPQIP